MEGDGRRGPPGFRVLLRFLRGCAWSGWCRGLLKTVRQQGLGCSPRSGPLEFWGSSPCRATGMESEGCRCRWDPAGHSHTLALCSWALCVCVCLCVWRGLYMQLHLSGPKEATRLSCRPRGVTMW